MNDEPIDRHYLRGHACTAYVSWSPADAETASPANVGPPEVEVDPSFRLLRRLATASPNPPANSGRGNFYTLSNSDSSISLKNLLGRVEVRPP